MVKRALFAAAASAALLQAQAFTVPLSLRNTQLMQRTVQAERSSSDVRPRRGGERGWSL